MRSWLRFGVPAQLVVARKGLGMSWDNLDHYQLRELARFMDWAEHHAMYEYGHATETTAKNMWSIALRDLAKQQVDIRGILEKRKTIHPFGSYYEQ